MNKLALAVCTYLPISTFFQLIKDLGLKVSFRSRVRGHEGTVPSVRAEESVSREQLGWWQEGRGNQEANCAHDG